MIVKAVRIMMFFGVCFSWCVYGTTVYGHRGARGLAPENTLPAYEVALAHHVDYVDLDVTMTKDGELVVQHDLTLNPDLTRDEKGRWVKSSIVVKELTLKQLQTYDVGKINPKTPYASLFKAQKSIDKTPIPTLRDVIRYVKEHADSRVGFQIELKTDPTKPEHSVASDKIVKALAQLIREEDVVSRTKVQAYDWQCLLMLQKLNPAIPTAYITDSEQEKVMRDHNPVIAGQWSAGFLLKNYHNSIPEMIHALGGTYWDAEDTELTSEKIAEAHRLGLKVSAWSWPEKVGKDVDIKLIKKLIAMHVDGIITDRPDVVMAFIHASDETIS
jgi:glycerophosphoryl diester phosphodiesterase